MSEKVQYFNGLKFTRDDETGYYLNSTIRKRMHRYVWEFYHGKIPKFYQVHHKDGDRGNNDISNLELIRVGEHQRMHGEKLSETERQWRRDNLLKNACPKAAEWHRSPEGREWHKQHGKETIEKLPLKDFVCEFCGKSFQSIQTGSRFCSSKCKSAWRRASGRDNEERICPVCGRTFIVNRYSTAKTCSRSCANKTWDHKRNK